MSYEISMSARFCLSYGPKMELISPSNSYFDGRLALHRFARIHKSLTLVHQQRLHKDNPRVLNVHDVWNTLGSRCTNIAGSLGRSHSQPAAKQFFVYLVSIFETSVRELNLSQTRHSHAS